MSLTVAYPTKHGRGESFKKHIRDSSGLKDIEVLEYPNPNKKRSLTEIYNQALKDASNDKVLLIHDDLFFNKESEGKWGKRLLKHFDESDFGILGVAGTTHVPSSGKWWEDPSKMVGIVNHSHVDDDGNKKSWESKYSNNFGKRIIETAVLDGLFIAVHKGRIKENFDEDIKGLHFYDIDFTFRNHLKGVKVGVVFDIRVTHKSIGETDEEWETNRKQFVEKYAMHPDTGEPLLPYHIEPELIYDDKPVKIKKENQPELLVIIPSGGDTEMVKGCLRSIRDKTDYENYKVVLANTLEDPERKNELAESVEHDERFIFVDEEYPSFAEINNKLVKDHANESTELILFCNDDIELINDAISRMVSVYNKNKKTCGTLGARLHFGDGSVQHSGIVLMLGRDGKLRLSHYGINSFYNYRDNIEKGVFGNTGGFMMVNKDLFNNIGGFNTDYKVAFEDVQFNIDCLKKGKQNIFVGTAVAYHYERQTKDKNEDKDQKEVEDYKKAINYIINNPTAYDYFLNIRRKDFEMLIAQEVERQKQQEQQQES